MPVQPALETVLTAHGQAVTLRASLRAATTIENMPGGFAGAYEGLLSQSLAKIRAVILATATDRRDAQAVLTATADKPLHRFLSDAQAACLAVLAALISNDGDDSADNAPSQGSKQGASLPLREYFQTLYRYGTGWLGWSPADTWAASPAEIEAAFSAHVDRLVMMTPGASRDDRGAPDHPNIYSAERLREIEELGYDPAFDREGLARLKALG